MRSSAVSREISLSAKTSRRSHATSSGRLRKATVRTEFAGYLLDTCCYGVALGLGRSEGF